VFSKLAFLIFGIVITAAFFYFLDVEQDLNQLNQLALTADSVANVIGVVSASPFNTTLEYREDIDAKLLFENQTFQISRENLSLRHPLFFPINTTGEFEVSDCLLIEKQAEVTVSACQ
jgi:hypothetical protein